MKAKARDTYRNGRAGARDCENRSFVWKENSKGMHVNSDGTIHISNSYFLEFVLFL